MMHGSKHLRSCLHVSNARTALFNAVEIEEDITIASQEVAELRRARRRTG